MKRRGGECRGEGKGKERRWGRRRRRRRRRKEDERRNEWQEIGRRCRGIEIRSRRVCRKP